MPACSRRAQALPRTRPPARPRLASAACCTSSTSCRPHAQANDRTGLRDGPSEPDPAHPDGRWRQACQRPHRWSCSAGDGRHVDGLRRPELRRWSREFQPPGPLRACIPPRRLAYCDAKHRSPPFISSRQAYTRPCGQRPTRPALFSRAPLRRASRLVQICCSSSSLRAPELRQFRSGRNGR